MTMVEETQQLIRVFGTSVRLPKLRLTVTSAHAKILRRRKKGESEEVRVKWEMNDWSDCVYSYAKDASDDGPPGLLVLPHDN
jgi:hypothetical protein